MEEEKNSKIIPGFIAALWLLAFGSCLFYLFYLDAGGDQVATQDIAVAEIAQSGGEVETRGDNAMLWSRASKGRQLAQGSHLSTGEKSRVDVRFRDGRRMRLGAHTQIVISEESKDGESVLVVSLVSGSLTALPPAAEAGRRSRLARRAPLIVRAGGKAVRLARPEDGVELKKEAGHPPELVSATAQVAMVSEPQPLPLSEEAAAPVVVAKLPPPPAVSPLPKQAAPVPVAAAPVAPARVAPAPIRPLKLAAVKQLAALPPPPRQREPAQANEPTPPPPPKAQVPPPVVASTQPVIKTKPAEVAAPPPAAPPPLEVKGLEPRVLNVDPDTVYWTEASLSDHSGTTMSVIVAPPTHPLPKGASWQPFIRGDIAGMEPVRVLGVPGGEQTLHLPLANLATAATAPVAVKLTIGAIVRQAASKERGVAVALGPTLTVASLKDLAKGEALDVQLVLGGSSEPTMRGWWARPPVIKDAPLTIHLAEGQDLRRLRPLLQAASALSVTPSKRWPSGSGYSFVRSSRVVASASGTASDLARARSLAQDLRANLVFLGPPGAFLAEPDEQGDFVRRIAGKGWAKHTVYIYDRRPGDASYSMHAITLTANSDIAQYVGEGADAVFSQPVDLWSLASPKSK